MHKAVTDSNILVSSTIVKIGVPVLRLFGKSPFMDAMPSSPNRDAKLTKAPLQEVIFEAFWELDIDPQTKENFDPGFDLAQGVFAELVREKFPLYKRIPPPIVPPALLNRRPVHQFRKAEDQWPVLQLGPGLFTANDTEKTYIWETEFRPIIEFGLDTVIRSYREPLRFEKVGLRYIDAAELEGEFKGDFIKFIETNLQIRILRGFDLGGTIRNQSLSQVYLLEDGSTLHLTIADGRRNNKPAVVWQTAIVKEKQMAVEEIKNWISQAHSTISGLFKHMLRKEYYDSLK
jgi:uncharacterized protein (TIGR04255 family)